MKKKIELVMAVILLTSAFFLARKGSVLVNNGKAEEKEICIAIDAGHGGDDPGKIGINDAKEKDINLNEIKTLLTYTNLVSSYNGFLQFSISKPAEEQHGPTVHIDIYEPKDSAKKNLLKQALESIE